MRQASLPVFLLERRCYWLTGRILSVILNLHSDVFLPIGRNLELLDFLIINCSAGRGSHEGDTINISND